MVKLVEVYRIYLYISAPNLTTPIAAGVSSAIVVIIVVVIVVAIMKRKQLA